MVLSSHSTQILQKAARNLSCSSLVFLLTPAVKAQRRGQQVWWLKAEVKRKNYLSTSVEQALGVSSAIAPHAEPVPPAMGTWRVPARAHISLRVSSGLHSRHPGQVLAPRHGQRCRCPVLVPHGQTSRCCSLDDPSRYTREPQPLPEATRGRVFPQDPPGKAAAVGLSVKLYPQPCPGVVTAGHARSDCAPAPDPRRSQLQAVPSPQTDHCSPRKEPQHVLISYTGQ